MFCQHRSLSVLLLINPETETAVPVGDFYNVSFVWHTAETVRVSQAFFPYAECKNDS